MKKFFTVNSVLLLLIVCNCSHAQTNAFASAQTENKGSAIASTSGGSKTKQELNKITKEVVNALWYGDKKVLGHYLADNYLSTRSNGAVRTKTEMLGILQSEPTGTTWDIEDVKIKDYGNTAIESFKLIFSFETADQKITQMERNTIMFINQGGQWKLIASHTSDIPADKSVAKVDPAIYDAYVGQYKLSPDIFLILTRKDDKLMGQINGRKTSFEILPENETTFFMKGEQDQITFVKDNNGQVSHILHYYADGHDVKEIKVK